MDISGVPHVSCGFIHDKGWVSGLVGGTPHTSRWSLQSRGSAQVPSKVPPSIPLSLGPLPRHGHGSNTLDCMGKPHRAQDSKASLPYGQSLQGRDSHGVFVPFPHRQSLRQALGTEL